MGTSRWMTTSANGNIPKGRPETSRVATICLFSLLLAASTLPLPTSIAQSPPQCGFSTPASTLAKTPVQNFDTDLVGSSGWRLESSHPQVQWQVHRAPTKNAGNDAIGHSEPGRLYYGFPNKTVSHYRTGTSPNEGTAVSPALHVPTGASDPVLYFNSSYEIESGSPSTRDLMTVETSTNQDASWTLRCRLNPSSSPGGLPGETVCSNGFSNGAFPCPSEPNGPQWEQRSISLSSVVGSSVLVRFKFNTMDGIENDGMGWMLDDVRVAYTSPVACNDGIDNDGDGKIDYPTDTGCTSSTDTNEANPPPPVECNDGIDNDGDGKTDFPNDTDCSSSTDTTERPPPPPACSDGLDNDGDGRVDMNDTGCSQPSDTDEFNAPPPGPNVPVMSPTAMLALAGAIGIIGAVAITLRSKPKH